MTQYGLWLKGCEQNHTLLYKLEHNDYPETGLFKLTREHMVRGQAFYDTPVYMVWWKGEQLTATTSYQVAYRRWDAEVQEDQWQPFKDLGPDASLDDWLALQDKLMAEGKIK